MVSISFRYPIPAYMMTPSSNIQTNSWVSRSSRQKHSAVVEFFFGQKSWIPIICYFLIASLLLSYNVSVFSIHFGEDYHIVEGIFSEVVLLRVITVQWLISLMLAAFGFFWFHEICLPVYVFLSILTTNGSAVLFAINARKVYDGIMDVESQYFMIICFLFGASIAHCVIYVYAFYLQEKNDRIEDVHLKQHFFWDFLQFRRLNKNTKFDTLEWKQKNIYSIA